MWMSVRRQIASVYVWVRVTFGEPGFAPRPIEAAQPPAVQEHWRRSWNFAWWRLLTSDNPGSTYRCLRAELDALATALATTIDPSHPVDSTLGTAPLYVSRYSRRPRKPRTLTATIGSADQVTEPTTSLASIARKHTHDDHTEHCDDSNRTTRRPANG